MPLLTGGAKLFIWLNERFLGMSFGVKAFAKVGVFLLWFCMNPRLLTFLGKLKRCPKSVEFYCVRFCIKLPHVVWSFLANWSGGSGVLVMLEILAANVLGFVLRFYVGHWLL